jgi:choline dehydrogenase-like flavoprotein
MQILRGLEPGEAHADVTAGVTRFLQGGTCRFGDDPRRACSIATASCTRCRTCNVTDGAFMPNGGSVPVTLTILANSFRVADHIAARFRDRTL